LNDRKLRRYFHHNRDTTFGVRGLLPIREEDAATSMAGRTYRVMYHVGDALTLRTKVLRGRASLTRDALTITGPSPVELPLRDLHAAELFRLHGLGRCVRISHEKGVVYVSVVRFVLFGYFAVINFLRTGELARRLREAMGGRR
jgi:hypothetical protein